MPACRTHNEPSRPFRQHAVLHPPRCAASRMHRHLPFSPPPQDTRTMATPQAHAATAALRCRGVLPSVAAILPEAAITYGLFDLLKRAYVTYSGGAEAGVLPSLAAGVAAAFTGQVVAYPLETVSRRMQVQSPPVLVLQPQPECPATGAGSLR